MTQLEQTVLAAMKQSHDFTFDDAQDNEEIICGGFIEDVLKKLSMQQIDSKIARGAISSLTQKEIVRVSEMECGNKILTTFEVLKDGA